MKREAYRLELTGQTFGRWKVLGYSHKNKYGELLWLCRCECGTERPVKAGILRKGQSTSCGCYHREAVTSHGMTKTTTHKSWESMLGRCQNPKDPSFEKYGGRGIKVCERWQTFESFLQDMGERPKGCTIDRENNDGDYEPGNCRWADAVTQQRNRTVSKFLTVNGATKPLIEWANEKGMEYSTLLRRFNSGWSPEDIVNRPSQKSRKQ